ncbi:GAF domain-containing protein [Chamaesiphon sp. VAR_69_metabat_338]|uniref:GAF domain-containing protein n=1 Tax=Chamaesiphon sp. VAR_69_metabat_338 TaxID=2964704 RepID=UPI00286DC178|nr:GAF domain-containing protein [Chamaesiphon sp. VAR_69_metabat_338]
MFANLISRIHDCSRVEDILQASVENVKQSLNCDRAVVYSLQSESIGEVVAESVNPGFPQTMKTTIEDPCFMARHVDTYRQGRITTIDNIQEARMTPCYIETLEKLAVKANLVVPLLLPDNELYGLLIVHQCSQPRAWTPAEVTLTAQMALQIGWAISNATRWSESYQLKSGIDKQKYYNDLLITATQKIHQGTTRLEVLDIAVAQAQAMLGGDRAIVYGTSPSNLGRVFAESTLPALAPLQGTILEDSSLSDRRIEEYRYGRVDAIDNIYNTDGDPSSLEFAKIAIKASLVVPIMSDGRELFGLLSVHQCFNHRQWQEMEIDWLRQIGIQTGLALVKAQLQEEVTAMKSSLKRAGVVKETISTADTQVQQVKESLSNSIQTIDEAKHLMRLLSHEVVNLTDKLSSEDLNLVRIITKKLQANAEVASDSTLSLQSEVTQLETVVNSAIQMYKSRKANEDRFETRVS